MTGVVLKHALSERGDDLYETPAVAVKALLRHERLPHRLWEPACGPGNIVNVLRAAGHEVIGSDLVDYGDPTHFYRRDFLLERKAPDGCEGIVTNPPFKLAEEFVAHALDLSSAGDVVAPRLSWRASAAPRILEGRGLARIHVFRNRFPMMHRARMGGTESELGDGVRVGSSGIAAIPGRRRSIESRGSDHDPPRPTRGRAPTQRDPAPHMARTPRRVVDACPAWRSGDRRSRPRSCAA